MPPRWPGVCKVHANTVFLPREVDARNAFCLTHHLGCGGAVPSARHLPPLGSFPKLRLDYARQHEHGMFNHTDTRCNWHVHDPTNKPWCVFCQLNTTKLTLHHQLHAHGGGRRYAIIGRALVKASMSPSHIMDGQEARFVFLSHLSHLHLPFSLWKTEWAGISRRQHRSLNTHTPLLPGEGRERKTGTESRAGNHQGSRWGWGGRRGNELRGQRKIMPRVGEPRGKRKKKKKGGAVQVESGTRSTAGGWVRPEKASVDTETTPHWRMCPLVTQQ